MPKRQNKANDLFLLMLNLSQVSLKEKIIDIFLEAIKEIWQNITITFKLSSPEKEDTIIELSSASSHYGFISIQNFSELKSEDQDLLHNACGMLAIILKKNEHEELIADEKLLLEKLVEERTQHLKKENLNRKRAEENLRAAKENLKSTFDISPSIISKANVDTGYFIEISPAVTKILGFSVEEFTSRPIIEFIHPDDRQRTVKEILEQLQGKEVASFENRYLCKDGSYKWIAWQGTPADKNGVVTAIGADINKRKQAEQKLFESEAKYRHLFETMTQGVAIQDTDGSIIEANSSACEILGLTMDQMLGKTNYDPRWRLIHEDGSPYDPNEMPSSIALQTGKSVKGVHCGIYVPEKDEYRWIVIGSVPRFRDGETKPFVTTTVFTDITELKKLESKLLQSQKMESIGKLAGGIAHDFNNVLYPVIGFTEMSMDDLPESHPVQENLKDILDGAKRARDLVKQILLFSRQKTQILKPILLKPVVEEALKLIRASIPHNIDIQQDLYEDEDFVLCDTTQIHEIVLNLCTNAHHAVEDKGGLIKITLDKIKPDPELNLSDDNYICLSVMDDGIGIPSDAISKIFEPYYTSKAIGKGSGLGLSVVHGIATSYKGDISVKSEPGKGSVFKVFLPITQRTDATESKKETQKSSGGTEKILFVDDEKAIVKLGTKSLGRLGYAVTGIHDSLEALALVKSNPDEFDLVITDMAMPGMVGTQLAKEILKIRPNIPIILCSGYSEKLDKEKSKLFNIKAFIDKPILLKSLTEKVREILNQIKVDNEKNSNNR